MTRKRIIWCDLLTNPATAPGFMELITPATAMELGHNTIVFENRNWSTRKVKWLATNLSDGATHQVGETDGNKFVINVPISPDAIFNETLASIYLARVLYSAAQNKKLTELSMDTTITPSYRRPVILGFDFVKRSSTDISITSAYKSPKDMFMFAPKSCRQEPIESLEYLKSLLPSIGIKADIAQIITETSFFLPSDHHGIRHAKPGGGPRTRSTNGVRNVILIEDERSWNILKSACTVMHAAAMQYGVSPVAAER